MDFRVQLDNFRGPIDLLLFLVRKHEVDVCDIPIALITDQYLEHLEVLQQLDVNEVGDFLELASTLVEIKSQLVLPRGGEEAEAWDDPRDELVQRLLEYKRYKDAASMLDERSRDWQQHLARLASDLPPAPPGQAYELWAIAGGTPRPAGVFTVDARGRGRVEVPPLPAGVAVEKFAVTLEPESGVPSPTGPMMLVSS